MLGFLNFQGEGFRKQAQNLTVKSIFWRGSWGYIFPSLSVRYNARPKKMEETYRLEGSGRDVGWYGWERFAVPFF
jgi:hypothetical protein